jgi:hypothetical protein
MKNKILVSAVVSLLVPASLAFAGSQTAETMRIAETYGFSGWDSVEALHYTFNVTRDGKTTKRRWEWDVKTGQVTLETREGDSPIMMTYSRQALDQGDAAANEKADRWFVNDEYWLLFPFHLIWDTNYELTFDGIKPLPIGRGRAGRMTVTYPSDGGGYTPGDTYEIFYGPITSQDERLRKPPESGKFLDRTYVFRQWIFRRAGKKPATLAADWGGYKRLGPIVVSTEHRDAFGKFHLWFSDLKIKLVNDAEWKYPGPVDAPPSK